MIGGAPPVVARLEPVFRTLAPGSGSVPRTPGREAVGGTAEMGYLHCGPVGAGHFVKMIHNGIEYGHHERVPWGISESGFAALDAALDYQYQSFGVPGLGLKRGLGKDLVIAPYATALALTVYPRAAVANFHALANQGGEGPYGFYEALDFTRDRTRDQRGPANVVLVVGVAAVDDDVIRPEPLGEVGDDLLRRRPGRHHDPDRARRRESLDELVQRGRTARSLVGELTDGAEVRRVGDDLVTTAHEAARHVAPHAAQPDRADLHASDPLLALRVALATFAG